MMRPGWRGRSGSLSKCPSLIHSQTHSFTHSLWKTKSKSLCLCFTGGQKEQHWPQPPPSWSSSPPAPLLHHWSGPPERPQRIIPSNRKASYTALANELQDGWPDTFEEENNGLLDFKNNNNLEYSRYTSIFAEVLKGHMWFFFYYF